MATTTTAAFDEFDENLKLDPDERKRAQELHNEITSILRDTGIITSAFLQGSFARKTMIKPLRDIDKIVILDDSMADLSPDEVMDRIEGVLAAEYPEATFDRTRHALQVDFGSETFYFDTVPAWNTPSDGDDDVLIANRDSGGWDLSNTRELLKVVAERNGETNGRFVHQARMAKQAVKHLLDGSIPGLHSESWAFDSITESMSHDEAVHLTLQTGADLLGGRYTEPTGRDDISTRLDDATVVRAKAVLADAARRAGEARDLSAAGDHNEAIRIWRGIFGDEFPEPDDQDDRTALSRAFEGGGVTSAGTVSTAPVGQTSRPTRSWRR